MNSSFMKWRIKRRFLLTRSESWIASRGMTALGVAALTLCAIGTCFLPSANAQVTPQRLVDSAKEPQNWLMYSGNYGGHRFSALDQINTSNAAALVPKWAYQTMAGGKFETTPLVVDGILYGTGQDNRAFALDARSGRPIWQYQRALPADIRPCCGRVIAGWPSWEIRLFWARWILTSSRSTRKQGTWRGMLPRWIIAGATASRSRHW